MAMRWLCASVLGLMVASCGGGSGEPVPQGELGAGAPPATSNSPPSGGDPTPTPTPTPAPEDPQPPSSGSGDDGNGDSGGGDSGTATPAPGPLTGVRFNRPADIAADANGSLYVIDGEEGSNRIRQIRPDGSVSTLVSENSREILALAVTADGVVFYSTSELIDPASADWRVAIWRVSNGTPMELVSLGKVVMGDMLADPVSGDIYLTVDQAVWRMRQDGSLTKLVDLGLFASIALQAETLWIGASDGRAGVGIYRWKEGEELEEILPFQDGRYLIDLTFANAGLYFTTNVHQPADSRLSCVLSLLNPDTGEVTAVAGAQGEECGYQDGTGESARLAPGSYITEASDGNLYLSDFNNHVIRKVTPEGEVTIYAGVPGEPGN
jgi:hypothetical protein